MARDIRVPALGESVTEAGVARWLKNKGDYVKLDEMLVELETDKVSVEVPSPAAGRLAEISADVGSTVAIGAVLGVIDESAKDEQQAPASAAASAQSSSSMPLQSSSPQAAVSKDVPLSPAVRKLVADNKINADAISGTGKDGRPTTGDVLGYLGNRQSSQSKAPEAQKSSVPHGDEDEQERVRMTRLRATIARRLKDAQNNAAMLTTFNEVDMSVVMEMRNRYKELFEKKHGVKLGFMGFFVKACIRALKEIPSVNAEIDGEDIVYKNYYHIGVAVGTERGLVVPVVRNAGKLSLADIEKTIAELGRKARDGHLSIADMQGGSFTISNGGVYGSLMSTPILNAPQSGILGMHKIQERPIAVGGQIVVRPMMYLALSYDHRLVDGKEAVTFLVRVKESLEDPQRALMDL